MPMMQGAREHETSQCIDSDTIEIAVSTEETHFFDLDTGLAIRD